jgi:hypothetical protein
MALETYEAYLFEVVQVPACLLACLPACLMYQLLLPQRRAWAFTSRLLLCWTVGVKVQAAEQWCQALPGHAVSQLSMLAYKCMLGSTA